MDEYIKRAEVRSALEKINPVDFWGMMDYEAHHGASEALRFAGYAIDDIPAADVEPVVHAHWIPKPQIVRSPYARNYSCSHCGHEPLEAIGRCPNCGAHMDVEA